MSSERAVERARSWNVEKLIIQRRVTVAYVRTGKPTRQLEMRSSEIGCWMSYTLLSNAHEFSKRDEKRTRTSTAAVDNANETVPPCHVHD